MLTTSRIAAALLVASLALLLGTACSSTATESGDSAPRLSFYKVLDATDPEFATTALTHFACRCEAYEHQDCPHDFGIKVGPERTFKLAQVFATSDSLGYPAVGFAMAGADVERFADFTEECLHRQLAIVIDGEVQCSPTVDARLPGRGIIRGHYSEEERDQLVAALAAETVPKR